MHRIGHSALALGLGAVLILAVSSCAAPAATLPPAATSSEGMPRVLAAESFLADIAQNVAGDRLAVESLIPRGVDPHSFEPTPADLARVADCDVLIVNGAGLEAFLERLLQNAGGRHAVVEAAAGLVSREAHADEAGSDHEGDPHFWLDPNHVIRYVENIRQGLSQVDPAGSEEYRANSAAYIAKLEELDAWIASLVRQVPEDRRLLVTNHESFGYFADRYGFTVVGTVLFSVSSGASPSAQQLAHLVDRIRETGAPAVFLETGSNPLLAQQLARETDIKVVTELYTHSLTPPGGNAPDYIAMMRHNARVIVDALR